LRRTADKQKHTHIFESIGMPIFLYIYFFNTHSIWLFAFRIQLGKQGKWTDNDLQSSQKMLVPYLAKQIDWIGLDWIGLWSYQNSPWVIIDPALTTDDPILALIWGLLINPTIC